MDTVHTNGKTSNGWVKNSSNRQQAWGNFIIPVGAVELAPPEVVASVRTGTIPGVIVLDDDHEQWVFGQTEHKPFGERYR